MTINVTRWVIYLLMEYSGFYLYLGKEWIAVYMLFYNFSTTIYIFRRTEYYRMYKQSIYQYN